MCGGVWRCVAVRGSVWQCVAVCGRRAGEFVGGCGAVRECVGESGVVVV